MTALHQFQPGAYPLAVRFPSLPFCHAPQLLGHRDPIASRALSFLSRKLACQGLLAHIHSQLLEHFSKYVSKRLHHFSKTVLSSVAVLVGFDANENGLTYAKILFASGAKEND